MLPVLSSVFRDTYSTGSTTITINQLVESWVEEIEKRKHTIEARFIATIISNEDLIEIYQILRYLPDFIGREDIPVTEKTNFWILKACLSKKLFESLSKIIDLKPINSKPYRLWKTQIELNTLNKQKINQWFETQNKLQEEKWSKIDIDKPKQNLNTQNPKLSVIQKVKKLLGFQRTK